MQRVPQRPPDGSVADDVNAFGWGETETDGSIFGFFWTRLKIRVVDAAKAVGQHHACEFAALEAHAHRVEAAFLFGRGFKPVKAVLHAKVFQAVVAFDLVAAGEQGGGTTAQRVVELWT